MLSAVVQHIGHGGESECLSGALSNEASKDLPLYLPISIGALTTTCLLHRVGENEYY